MAKIRILNPNSSAATTDAMIASAGDLGARLGHELTFATLAEGPPGIETQLHVESVVLPVLADFRAHPADAYVIGCFSDPGLHLCREQLGVPVIGIAEAAYLAAVGLGARFGVVSIVSASVKRHLRQIRVLGLEGVLAGDRPLDMSVAEMSEAERTVTRVVEVGTTLRDADGADVLILGCASMGIYRPVIEERLGMPVVDPVQASLARASTLLALGYGRMS